MRMVAATEEDFAEVVALANVAYRKTGEGASWNAESGIIAGQRLDATMLREDLATKPGSVLLIAREDGMLAGTVWLEPKGDGVWYLGLLTVEPALQARKLGSEFLAAGEAYAREHGARTMRITVLSVREALIGWYERRGYSLTGEREPWPYGDERYGVPLRDDLEFVVMEKAI